MKQAFLDNSISLITKHNKSVSLDDIEKIRYGLEGVYLTIFKLAIIFIMAIIFGIIKEVLLLLLAYNILRFFAFGFHANSSNECLALSIGMFLVLPLGVFTNLILLDFAPLICFVCLIGFLFFSPSDTVKRPLPNKKKRIIRKTISSFLVFIYALICAFSNNTLLINLLVLAVIIEFVMINPITYKVYGQPYNNYKTY